MGVSCTPCSTPGCECCRPHCAAARGWCRGRAPMGNTGVSLICIFFFLADQCFAWVEKVVVDYKARVLSGAYSPWLSRFSPGALHPLSGW